MIRRLFALLLLGGLLGAGWLYYDLQQFRHAPLELPAEGLAYQLAAGSSINRLADDLQQLGVLRQPLYLRLLGRLDGSASRLRAGEYLIPAGTTPIGLLQLLVSGKTRSHSLTLVEGWTFRQALAAIWAHEALEATLTGLDDAAIMERLGLPEQHPEGRFLAETYHFPRGTSDLEFLRRAHRSLEQALAAAWEGRAPDLPLRDPYEALIMASIIEKETGLASERGQISGVFARRLRKGMLLQTDPTIIYGLGDSFDGNLRRQDLRQDQPYNTYTRPGLPPTPICLPGKDSLHAALHPEDGDSLYFVSKGDGSHHFSATLAEHNQAVRRYQLRR
jgi:UPF0755 protein